MNKETKVGMLVGLSFIVLFGVILSKQAPDIVAPPERPMLNPAAPHRTNTQVVRQIESAAPAPEPVDVVAETPDKPAPADAAKTEPKPADAVADASGAAKTDAKPAEPTTLSASNPAGATKTITADNLGPETADAEPGDDGMQVISSKVDADGNQTTVYVVKNGDSLAKISRRFYGDATNRNIDKIFEANKEKMPDKKTLKVGMPLQVPASPKTAVKEKDKSADDLLSSGAFDQVAELKPAGKSKDAKDATAIKDAAPAKDASAAKDAKEPGPAPQPKETPKPATKDAKKSSPSKTAVAEVSQDTLEDILLKRTPAERPSQSTTSAAELARIVEQVEKIGERIDAEAKDSAKPEKETDKTALASRDNCKHYQTQKGDTWYKLAAKFMGDAKRWHDLYALNDDIMPDATKLRPGVSIRVPAGSKSRLDYALKYVLE